MKSSVFLGVFLMVYGLFFLLLRLGTGHSLNIVDVNSFVTVISPLIIIITSVLLLINRQYNKQKSYFLQAGLLLSAVSIMYAVYDFIKHWRNSFFYFFFTVLMLFILMLIVRFILQIYNNNNAAH